MQRPALEMTVEEQSSLPKQPIFDEEYLTRLRAGDDNTASHFQRHFRRLLRAQLWGKFDQQRQEDLVDDVMTVAVENILQGEPRDATRLSAYIRGICSNLTKVEMRRSQYRKEPVQLDFDRVPTTAKNAEENLIERETAKAAMKVLSSLSSRDRAMLVDLFYEELPREDVCAKHGVTREQLRLILFHARRRFQGSWENLESTARVPLRNKIK